MGYVQPFKVNKCYNKGIQTETNIMNVIAVSGVRRLDRGQSARVITELRELSADHWHVGDAEGVDRLARLTAQAKEQLLTTHHKDTRLPYKVQGAERSTRMIKALAATGGTLHAWVNKPAPAGLKPGKTWGKAQGSGTWGTVALAVGYGLEVELHPLTEDAIAPGWMKTAQLVLL